MFRFLVIFLVSLINLSYTTTVYIDCNGKGFFCENTTSFRICVDMGNGITQTVDNLTQHCPQGYECKNNAPFECVRIVSTYPQELPQQAPIETQNNGINQLAYLETNTQSESGPVPTLVENANEETLTTGMTHDPQSITHTINNPNILNNSTEPLLVKPFLHNNMIEQFNQTYFTPNNTESWKTGGFNLVHNIHPHNYTYESVPMNTYNLQMPNTTNGYSTNYSNIQYYSDIRNQQPVQTSVNSQILKNNTHPENSIIYSQQSNSYPDGYRKSIQEEAMPSEAERTITSVDGQNIEHKNSWQISSHNTPVSSDFSSSHRFDHMRQFKDDDSPSMIYHEDIFKEANENVHPLSDDSTYYYPKINTDESYNSESVNYLETPEINLSPNTIHGHFINYTTVNADTTSPSNNVNLSPNFLYNASIKIGGDDIVNDKPRNDQRRSQQSYDSLQNQSNSPNYPIFDANPNHGEHSMTANTNQKIPTNFQSVGSLIHEKIPSVGIPLGTVNEDLVSDPLRNVQSDEALEEPKQTQNIFSPIMKDDSGFLKNDNITNLNSMIANDPPVVIKDKNYINYFYGLNGAKKTVHEENELIIATEPPITDLYWSIKDEKDNLYSLQHTPNNYENKEEIVGNTVLPLEKGSFLNNYYPDYFQERNKIVPVDKKTSDYNISNHTPIENLLNPTNVNNVSSVEIEKIIENIPSQIDYVVNSDSPRNIDDENKTIIENSYKSPLPYNTEYFSKTYYNNTTKIPEINNSREAFEQPLDIFKANAAITSFEDERITNISLPINIEGKNINISSLLVHNPLKGEEYLPSDDIPAIRNTSNILENDTNFTHTEVPQLLNQTRIYNNILKNESIENGIPNSTQSELLDTNINPNNTETPLIHFVPNSNQTIDLVWGGDSHLPDRERAESNIMSLLVNKTGSSSPKITNANLTSEDLIIQAMNLTNIPIEGSDSVSPNFLTNNFLVHHNTSSPDNLSRDEYILGLNLVPQHNENLGNNSISPLVNEKLGGEVNALGDDGKALPKILENPTEVKNHSIKSGDAAESTINPFAGLIEKIISHDNNESFIGDDVKATDKPKGVLAEYLNPITDNKPDSFVSVKELVVENNIMSPGDPNHNQPMRSGNLNDQLVVRPPNINNQPLRRPEYYNNEPLIRPEYNNNQPIVGAIDGQPLVRPANFNNQPLVRPGNINSQPLETLQYSNNQPLIGQGNINSQPPGRPEYNNNQQIARPVYNNNQPLIGPGNINGQPQGRPEYNNIQPLIGSGNFNGQQLVRPEYNNNQQIARPVYNNNQPLIGPGNINGQSPGRPENINNLPLVRPGNINNQPQGRPEFNNIQPSIGSGNLNGQQLGRPEYNNNQPLVRQEYNYNQPLVRPAYNNNQPLIGQGNINGQPTVRPANNYGMNVNGQINQVNQIPQDLERKTETSITERNTIFNRNPTLSGRVECTIYQSTPDVSTCHSYYVCRNNQQIRLFCPYNMIYSPILRTCTTEKEHCSSNGEFVCNSPGFYPDPKSCYSYYECEVASNGFKVNKYMCPWYSSFNPEYKKCVEGHSNCVGMNSNNNNYSPPNSPNGEFRNPNQNNYQQQTLQSQLSINNQGRMRMVGPNEVSTTPKSYIVHQQESSWIPRRVFYWF